MIQTVKYWPEGPVLVSVVDPGVGSIRRSVAVGITTGQFIVISDSRTLTHVKRMCGVKGARVIDESVNRLSSSGESYTFHGGGTYAYTGVRSTTGVITFEQVGPMADVNNMIGLPVVEVVYDGEKMSGTIGVLDVRFDSLWTNISRELPLQLSVNYGQHVKISIKNGARTLYKNILMYVKNFVDVYVDRPLVYVNSLDCAAVAISQGNFAKAYNTGTEITWRVAMRKAPRIVYKD